MTAEEAMLAFMARPGYQPMRLEALADAIGANKEDLRHLRKVIPGLLKAGAIAVRNGHDQGGDAAVTASSDTDLDLDTGGRWRFGPRRLLASRDGPRWHPRARRWQGS